MWNNRPFLRLSELDCNDEAIRNALLQIVNRIHFFRRVHLSVIL